MWIAWNQCAGAQACTATIVASSPRQLLREDENLSAEGKNKHNIIQNDKRARFLFHKVRSRLSNQMKQNTALMSRVAIYNRRKMSEHPSKLNKNANLTWLESFCFYRANLDCVSWCAAICSKQPMLKPKQQTDPCVCVWVCVALSGLDPSLNLSPTTVPWWCTKWSSIMGLKGGFSHSLLYINLCVWLLAIYI